MKMNSPWKYVAWTATALGVAAVIVFGVMWFNRTSGAEKKGILEAQERADERSARETPVKAVHPKQDPSLKVSVQQLLTIEPFFEADLRAQVAGVVSDVHKDIGDPVRRGELLIGIQVPDLDQQLLEKGAVVLQRQRDVDLAHAQLENVRALVDVYREVIGQREAEVGQAAATRDYREKRWNRFITLAKGGGINQNIVDEEERDYRAAEFAFQGAEAAVRKARADLKEKESAVHTAEADIELKESLVQVARKDRDRTQALVDYAQIVAPFDGVLVRRKVDVGAFVQNASTGASEPLMGIARTDIVTAVMQVPDNAAPYVTRDTDAVLQIDELPGVVIRGKVTRFSPSIRSRDRTMRVEVDLYNDSAERYGRFESRTVASFLRGLGATTPLESTALAAVSRNYWSRHSRSKTDPFPMMPKLNGTETAPQLLPGMTGYMRLNLQRFKDSHLLPSSAVFTRGGKPYILEVDDEGLTHLLPVRVQVNDGKLAKVSVIVQEAVPAHGEAEVLRELTGEETIILNRQAEIGEGQEVRVSLEEW
jgi:multidrug resistance efflux pump